MSGSLDDIQPNRPKRAKYDHAAIRRARARGVLWTQIGDYYGVTENAASTAHHAYYKRTKASK